MARDETTWTSWTLPPAISGCLAQRYRGCVPRVPVRAGLATTRGAAGAGRTRPNVWLCHRATRSARAFPQELPRPAYSKLKVASDSSEEPSAFTASTVKV
jgi:hypothetical protein